MSLGQALDTQQAVAPSYMCPPTIPGSETKEPMANQLTNRSRIGIALFDKSAII